MSYYTGSLFSFDINPQPLPRFWFFLLCLLLLLLSISIYQTAFYVWVFYAAYLYWVYRCYQEFVTLNRPKSARAISCQQGVWEIKLYDGKQIHNLYLAHYFLSSHYIVLHFLEGEKSSRFQVWKAKKTLMIVPAQLGEKNFRYLFRLLKFQNSGLFISE